MHDIEFTDPRIQEFAAAYTSPEDALLQEVAAFTKAHHKEPHMLSGHVQGKLLQTISYMLRPRRILEIGTFTGYSGLCLASGLADDGLLHTIELREETAAIARDFFAKSSLQQKIRLHTGKAADIIPTLKETWDLVFIDADKPGYIEYFDLAIGQVRKNGFILADNIFFHGQIFEEEPGNKSAKAIKNFNKYIQERTDIDKVVLTIRDGLYLLRKL